MQTGLNYIGKISKLSTSEYIDKNGNKGNNYNINFLYMGGFTNIRCDKDTYHILEEGKTYSLPIGLATSKNIDFTNLFVRKKDTIIFEIVDDEMIAIT